MVFTRPTPPADEFKEAMLRPKKYARTKRGKAEKERDRYAALTPAQRVAEEQEHQRKVAKENAAHERRQAEDRKWRQEQEQRRQEQEAIDNARKAREAEIERRAGIRWPGSVVDPAWIKANPAAVLSRITGTAHESMEDVIGDALDRTFKPLFNASIILPGVVEDKEVGRIHEDIAAGLRALIEEVVDYAFEANPVQVVGTQELIPAEPNFGALWKKLGANETIARFIARLKDSHDCCIDDSKTSEMFSSDTMDALKDVAMEDALDAENLFDAFEALARHEQESFIDEMQLNGYLSTLSTTA
jgi:hypothetical protein